METEETLKHDLEKRNYRYLQRTTKSLSLPSNYKKVYLIDLIIARKLGLEDEVDYIIRKVKEERVKSSEVRRQSKRQKQDLEKSLTRRFNYSPPISITPRRSQIALLRKTNSSNKILRSCNTRTIKHFVDIITAHSQEIVESAPRRQRTISGIYPLIRNEISGVSVRREDGTISKINAIVQKRSYEYRTMHLDPAQAEVKEIIDFDNSTQFANLSLTDAGVSETVNSSAQLYNSFCKRRADKTILNYRNSLPKIDDVSSRYHAVYRGISGQPLYVQAGTESGRLPMNSFFLPQTQSEPFVLETCYSIKKSVKNNLNKQSNTTSVYSTSTILSAKVCSPRPAPDNIDNVFSIYDACICRDEKGQRLASFQLCTSCALCPGKPKNLNHEDEYPEDLKDCPVTPLDNDGITIPEMFEDAFEIISQDGNYMDRIGLDSTSVQCVLCNWAGPTVLMEYHIRKLHGDDIIKQHTTEWNITLTLGCLVTDSLWLCKIIEYNSALYVLSAKYEDPDCFMATLSYITPDLLRQTAQITIYNKVTGEPQSWQGYIESLPPNMPYTNHKDGLKLNLTSLDLLPNSANLKLVNRELVIGSPCKVVVGQPELNDIHIILFVKL